MCLISAEIEKVSKTKILIAPNANNTRQLVVYSNYVNNLSESNAMVLPVPNPQTVEFIDLTAYSNLFEDCSSCFYSIHKSKSLNRQYLTNSFNTRDDKPLEVFNVGSYKISLAMNLEQISRVNSAIFDLSPGLKQTLEMFYHQPYWGFIICKLNSGPELYHPFAYSHNIIQSQIYIPTRHYHQEVKWSDVNGWALGLHIDPKHNPINMNSWNEYNIDSSPMFKAEKIGMSAPEANAWVNFNNNSTTFDTNNITKMSSKYENLKKLNDANYKNNQPTSDDSVNSKHLHEYKKIADDWSHSIYLLNINPNSNQRIVQMNSCTEIWDKKSLFDPDKINFNFGYCSNFTKLEINGTHPNIDLVIPI